MPKTVIRKAVSADLPRITEIYNEAILARRFTCDTAVQTVETRTAWFCSHQCERYPLYVCEEDGAVCGYAYLTPYSPRGALNGTAEISYYLDLSCRGRGLGTKLAGFLIERARALQFRHLIAILLSCNSASIALLKKFGFRQWGCMPGIAQFGTSVYSHLYYGLSLEAPAPVSAPPAFSLVPWRMNFAESLLQYADNPKIAANLRDVFPSPYTRADAEAYIRVCMEREGKRQLCRAILFGGEAVGSIGIFQGSDVSCQSAELGYWLGEPFWNRGILTAAVRELCEEAFRTLGVARIFAEPFAANTASRRVLEKAGFCLEGILKDSVLKNGVLQDACLYARLRPQPTAHS